MMTAAIIGLTALSAVGKMNAANAQAQAAVTQGNEMADQKRQQTEVQAGQATAGFLGSGFGFSGTAKNSVNDIFKTGLTDVGRIDANANASAKNDIASGRAAAIGQIASSMGAYAAGGGFGSAGAMTESSTTGMSGYELYPSTQTIKNPYGL